MKNFLNEFKKFISRGNVIDLAVGVIIGSAFTAIVNSLVTDIFTPLLSLLGGGTQMESLGITFGIGEHAATLAYGSFLSAVINFLITAFAIFCLVKAINTVQDKIAKKPEEEKKEPTTKNARSVSRRSTSVRSVAHSVPLNWKNKSKIENKCC